MKRFILFLYFLSAFSLVSSAQLVYTRSGQLHFFSEAPLENIEATSKQAQCVLNERTGQVSARVQMSTFGFAKSLMQQHFNENYLETAIYPDTRLEGKLKTPPDLTKDGDQPGTLEAEMTLHGVKKAYIIPVLMTVKSGHVVQTVGKWPIKLVDHKIEIPTLVIKKIAEVVEADFNFNLLPK